MQITVPTLDEMFALATREYGVYKGVDECIRGAFHSELAWFASDILGLDSRARRRLRAIDVMRFVLERGFFIASVSPQIRDASFDPPESRSGHLVLIYNAHKGSPPEEGCFELHNSAGLARTQTQSGVKVSFRRFEQCFSGNGVAIAAT